MVQEEVAGHEDEPALLGQREQLLGLGARLGRRLLHEDVLAGQQRLLGQFVVCHHGGRDRDRVQLRIGQQLLEVACGSRSGIPRRVLCEEVGREVAEPAKVGELGKVAGEVRAPVAEAGVADPDAHSFQTFPFCAPLAPVAFLRSTTSLARSTRSS